LDRKDTVQEGAVDSNKLQEQIKQNNNKKSKNPKELHRQNQTQVTSKQIPTLKLERKKKRRRKCSVGQ